MKYKILQGDCLEKLDELEDNSIDCIVTDPPYGLVSITKRFGKEGSAPAKYGKDGSFARLSRGFMGKEWDGSGIEYNVEMWQKCLRVLKPGGYLLAFGGTRTYHRITCAIEDAGFEIRDCIQWIYGSGFPKSTNIGLTIDKKNGVKSKVVGEGRSGTSSRAYQSAETTTAGAYQVKEAQNEWKGWGSALKPSWEPIVMARKPFRGSLVDNVLQYGVGGLNIDECRVETGDMIAKNVAFRDEKQSDGWGTKKCVTEPSSQGRFPANTILTYDETDFDEVCGGFPNTKQNGSITNPNLKNSLGNRGIYNKYSEKQPLWNAYQDSGSAARYFYCAKAGKKDRDEGLEGFEKRENRYMATNNGTGETSKGIERFTTQPKANFHPTVKPTTLMQYLIRLVAPKGAVVLDPFMGSGSTGKACAFENRERDADYKFIGIEQDPEYCKIAEARINYAANRDDCIEK